MHNIFLITLLQMQNTSKDSSHFLSKMRIFEGKNGLSGLRKMLTDFSKKIYKQSSSELQFLGTSNFPLSNVFMSIDLFLSYYTVCCISLSNVPQAGFTFLNSRAVHDFCCATHDNLYPSVAKLFIMPYYVHSSYEILFNHSCIFKILFSKKLDLQYI